jgi:hypothetical protein
METVAGECFHHNQAAMPFVPITPKVEEALNFRGNIDG